LTTLDVSPETRVSDERFRDLMSMVCGPVVVVTTAIDDAPAGTTVSSFSSLSLQPRMLMLALDRSSRLLDKLRRAGRFGVNVLDARQETTARAFATKSDDKFDRVDWSYRGGLPYLDGSPGWAECAVEALVPGGDHVIVVGAVHDLESLEPGAYTPLIYGGRQFGTHSGLSGS
jgi:flavin reductase (DIM6/NTAB) family NADH-FMN oxidoreductase RutF